MGLAAASLLIISQPLAVLATAMLPPMAMLRHGASRTAVAVWALALVLLATWAVSTYRTTVLADETGTEWHVLGTVHWLALALGAALASVVVVRRHAGRTRPSSS